VCSSGLFSVTMELEPSWTSTTMADYERCLCDGGMTSSMLSNDVGPEMLGILCSDQCTGMFSDMVLSNMRSALPQGDDSPLSSTATDAELRSCFCSGSPLVVSALYESEGNDLSALASASCSAVSSIRQLQTVVVASGDVSDYGSAVIASMRANVASLLGAPLEAVGITVASASVEITITITATEEHLEQSLNTHGTVLRDAAQMSALLSSTSFPVVVTQVSQLPAVLDLAASGSSPPSSPPDDGDNEMEVGVIVAIVAGIIAALVLSCGLVMMCKPSEQKTTTVQMTNVGTAS